MPIYEYRCASCQSTFERFQRAAGGAADVPCPSCGAAAPRQLSAFARPRGASPGPDDPEHPAPPPVAESHGHGHSHGPGGHSHGAMHGHAH